MARMFENLENAFEEMFDFITDLPSGLDGFESDFDLAFKELKELKAALTQPNEPLTEEQLEKMIGEPIWVESARRKEWMLLWGYHGPEVYGRAFIFTRRTAQKEQFPFSELRVTWWPYRRPPEGEE